jgi:hypothetical protein
MNHASTITRTDARSPREKFTSAPADGLCFVCGGDVREAWFARMNTGCRTFFLCSAACAQMFFEVKQPPAHDHRARHSFQRARDAIFKAARGASAEIERTGNGEAALLT